MQGMAGRCLKAPATEGIGISGPEAEDRFESRCGSVSDIPGSETRSEHKHDQILSIEDQALQDVGCEAGCVEWEVRGGLQQPSNGTFEGSGNVSIISL